MEKVILGSVFHFVLGRNPYEEDGLSIKLINEDKVLWFHIFNGCIWPECGDGDGESEPRPLDLSNFDGSIEDMLDWFHPREDYVLQ